MTANRFTLLMMLEKTTRVTSGDQDHARAAPVWQPSSAATRVVTIPFVSSSAYSGRLPAVRVDRFDQSDAGG
jgi:hypothetical protein